MTAHFGKFVAYYRMSTDKQGQSGLGLDRPTGRRHDLRPRPSLACALAISRPIVVTVCIDSSSESWEL
jgi:hypothetical protein